MQLTGVPCCYSLDSFSIEGWPMTLSLNTLRNRITSVYRGAPVALFWRGSGVLPLYLLHHDYPGDQQAALCGPDRTPDRLMTRFRTPVSKRRNGLLELLLLRVAVRKLRLSVRVRVVWEAESII